MWAKVAEDLGVPWRAAEAMHWQLGEHDMARRAGVVPFSMAPGGYAPTTSTAGGPVGSSSSSASGIDPSGYNDPSAQDVGVRLPSGLRESSVYGEDPEGGVRLREGYGGYGDYDPGADDVEARRRIRPVSGHGGQGIVLPSLAEFEGGVPAYAGFVGEFRGRDRPQTRGESVKEDPGSQEEEEEELEEEDGKGQ